MMKKNRTGLYLILLIVFILCLFPLGKWIFGRGHKLPVPSVDISAVPYIEQLSAKSVTVVHPDGSSVIVHTTPGTKSYMINGRIYEAVGTVPGNAVRLDKIQGYSVHDSEYWYFYSLAGFSEEEWLVGFLDNGKTPDSADYETVQIYKNLETAEIPAELSGILTKTDQ